MWTRFTDFDRSWTVFDELRRQMDRVWDDFEPSWTEPRRHAWNDAGPRFDLFDTGAEIVVRADVPGLSEKDFDISLNENVLVIAGERKTKAPEGYSVHRQERPAYKFSRSITLPIKVNPELASAVAKDGVLTIKIAKAAEAQPRRISVKAQDQG